MLREEQGPKKRRILSDWKRFRKLEYQCSVEAWIGFWTRKRTPDCCDLNKIFRIFNSILLTLTSSLANAKMVMKYVNIWGNWVKHTRELCVQFFKLFYSQKLFQN